MIDTDNIFTYIDKLDEEKEDGNIEYKRELVNLDEETMHRRVTQMKYRINEGLGEAFYYIGVTDNGQILGLNLEEYNLSIENLTLIATKIESTVIKIAENNKNEFYAGEFLIRKNVNDTINLKICVCGNVDAGKSSTIGTLTKGVLDDGRGKSRAHVFNFKHEFITGRTSSISHQILGFDKTGNIVNNDRNNSWTDIAEKSTKIVSFFDLAGHEKYLKTTIYGLTSSDADYAFIMIGANMGITSMTREHIGLCVNLKIPFIIIVTKIDIAPDNILIETMQKINNICKNKVRKIPYIIKNISDVINVSKNIKSDSIIPIIQISNVTNFNLDLLKSLINLLPIRNDYHQNINKHVEMLIDNTYSVSGHSTIVSGLLRSGTINVNDNLLIGPFIDSTYKQVKVRSIHSNYRDYKYAKAGMYICVSLKNITRREIKKNMLLITDNQEYKIAIKKFLAQIHILHSPTTIKIGYEPFVHVDNVRQCVKIIDIEKINNSDNEKILRTGDKANVTLEFLIRPEYIKTGMKLIFRESNVKAVGKIINIF